MARLLEEEGHKVICLAESEGAAEMIAEAKPDLLILDIVMPKVSGIDILRSLRARRELDTMPIVMVTAKTGSEDLREALDAGAFDYVRKPVDSVEILARVRAALRTREYMERLVYLAERDGLTGLYNHKTILREIDASLASLSQAGSSLALVMCDIDFFKKINDGYGHQAGDAVLAGIGALFAESLGSTGKAGRYGGEEFCIVLGGFDRAMAARWAEALRSHIESKEWDAEGKKLRFTMSFGVAWAEHCAASSAGQSSCAAARTARDLIAEADRRLYDAKKCGRNQVVSRESTSPQAMSESK